MKNVVLIFGGKSFEHDISIITALLIYNKTKSEKYHFIPVYVTKNNEWFAYEKNNFSTKLFKDFDNTYKKSGFSRAYLKTNEKCIFIKSRLRDRKICVDACLNCCHGGMGENGELVSIFEASGIPITSGSMSALAICMDKILTKYALRGLDIPSIDYFTFTKDEFENCVDSVLDRANKLGFPLILKPSRLGSSIGISVAKNKEEFISACKVAIEFDEQILVEKAILDMEEYNVACLKNKNETLVSKVDKPIRTDEILSFKDKYIGDGKKIGKNMPAKNLKSGAYTQKKTFISIDEKLEKKLQSIAKDVYEKLGLYGITRIDFIVKKNKIFVNEINSVPGSLGYYFFVPSYFSSMDKFVEALIENAIFSFSKRSEAKIEYITKLI